MIAALTGLSTAALLAAAVAIYAAHKATTAAMRWRTLREHLDQLADVVQAFQTDLEKVDEALDTLGRRHQENLGRIGALKAQLQNHTPATETEPNGLNSERLELERKLAERARG